MKALKVILLILFIFSGIATAQYTNIQISNLNAPEEPSICINPKNTNQVVAGANISSAYYSTNGGVNWTRFSLTSSLYGVWGDPCIIVDTNSNFYFFHLSNPPSGQGHWIDRIVCQKSTNGGANYNNPGSYTFYDANKDQDKEWACVDPRNNNIYATWTQFDSYGSSAATDSSNILFAKSTDGGTSWVGVKRINQLGGDCIDEDNTVEGAVPCVGPNGEVYVSWSGPKIRNSQFGIFFDKSTDGGNTWLTNDTYVTDQPGGWDFMIPGIQRCNGLPITSCDISNGLYRGNIYINWTDQRNGTTDTDVWFIKSTNGGANWSVVKRINNDAPGKQQFLTWMTVDQKTGYIYFVFYDRRDYTNNSTDVYLASSTDGGETFVNTKISTTSFLPNSSTFFGDYSNITAYNGKVRPIWARLDGSGLSVWTAIIDFPTGVENTTVNTPSRYSLEQNFPNPFNPVTMIKYNIPKASNVVMKVYDIIGNEVSTLVNTKQEAGTYEIGWDGSQNSSGVYFYKISAGEFTQTKTMMLVK